MWGKYILIALAVFANFGGVKCLESGERLVAIVEFRYCPPGFDAAEQMLACTLDQASASQEDIAAGYIHTSAWSNAIAMQCRNLPLRNDPVVAILSALLTQTSQMSSEESLSSMDTCEASSINTWTYRINNTVDTEAILESWSTYTSLNLLEPPPSNAPGSGAIPTIIPSLLCHIPLGFVYAPSCSTILDILWSPLGGLEMIFPYQFSRYCFLCWWIGVLVFDIAHWAMHRLHNSKYPLLRKIGWVHMIHHYYFNRSLQFNEKYAWHNTWVELPVEGFCMYLGSLMSWYGCAYFGLTDVEGGFTGDIFRKIVFTQVAKTMWTMYKEGKDANHPVGWKVVPKDPDFLSVGAEYHCLHHIEPDAYYSSFHRFFDHLIGSASSIKGKRILMTGSSGAYGQALIPLLQDSKIRSIDTLKFGTDWTHDDFSSAVEKLANADILILAHGTKGEDAMQANCESAVKLIELFRLHRCAPDSIFNKKNAKSNLSHSLPEIWYLGSEIEIISPSPTDPAMLRYSASKRAFAKYARAYYDDQEFVYRHIVPAGFTSAMGKGLVSAEWVAKLTMWWVRRGARYVPVTYTGMAYVNYWRFMGLEKCVGEREGLEVAGKD